MRMDSAVVAKQCLFMYSLIKSLFCGEAVVARVFGGSGPHVRPKSALPSGDSGGVLPSMAAIARRRAR